MAKKNFKEWSKDNWFRSDDALPTNEQLQIGCLQRIADATEATAKNYNNLLMDKERFERWYHEERAKREKLERGIIAHKANYTRLKNKLEAMKNTRIADNAASSEEEK